MPRRSAASLSVVPLDRRASRLRPPAHLSEAERSAFVDLVSACKPGHFQASDLPLLGPLRRGLGSRRAGGFPVASGRAGDRWPGIPLADRTGEERAGSGGAQHAAPAITTSAGTQQSQPPATAGFAL